MISKGVLLYVAVTRLRTALCFLSENVVRSAYDREELPVSISPVPQPSLKVFSVVVSHSTENGARC